MLGGLLESPPSVSTPVAIWIAGLVSVCDWIASNANYFPYRPKALQTPLDGYWPAAQRMAEAARGKARVAVAQPRFNTDNAAMIARAGWFHLQNGRESGMDLDADARLLWPGLERAQDRLPSPR